MALEAVVFPQDLFGCTMKELYSFGGGWSHDFGGVVEEEVDVEEKRRVVLECEMGGGLKGEEHGMVGLLDGMDGNWEWDVNSSSWSPDDCTKEGCFGDGGRSAGRPEAAVAAGRRKRRRTKNSKNKEEVESQRMTHIAVERNRRKQMNEYLAMLRSLMPPSYVQRGDQASIIGGAINFVKELEQLLQSLEAQQRSKQHPNTATGSPFADFFTFPQYSSSSSRSSSSSCSPTTIGINNSSSANEAMAKNRSAVADIEVTMVESHANLKVLSKRRPKQLLNMVVGLQNLGLTTLHLNVTSVDQMVLYSFSLKVEDDCQFTSVDEIATAVYQMVEKIEEDAGFH